MDKETKKYIDDEIRRLEKMIQKENRFSELSKLIPLKSPTTGANIGGIGVPIIDAEARSTINIMLTAIRNIKVQK